MRRTVEKQTKMVMKQYHHLSIEKDAKTGKVIFIQCPIADDISRDRYYTTAAWHKKFVSGDHIVFATSENKRLVNDAQILAFLSKWKESGYKYSVSLKAKDRAK